MHLNLSFMENCEVTDSSGIHQSWPLTTTPSNPKAPHSISEALNMECRCKGHQTCFVRSSSVVSPILLQVQDMVAYSWGHQLWQETHPLLQWEGEATQCGAVASLQRQCRFKEQRFVQSLHEGSRCLRGSSGLWHQLGLGGSTPHPLKI